MDEIEIIQKLAEKAQKEVAPHITVQGNIVKNAALFQYARSRFFEYLAIGSAVAAAIVLIVLFLLPGGGESAAEGIAQFFDQFNGFYSNY